MTDIYLRFDGAFWNTAAPDYLEKITGIILGKACIMFHNGNITPPADEASELFFTRFPELTHRHEQAAAITECLHIHIWAGLENYCGDYRETRDDQALHFEELPAIKEHAVYGPVFKDLLDRCYATGQEVARRFIADYGYHYREAVKAQPYSPVYAFAVGTLAAGLPLETWLSRLSDLTDELRLNIGETGEF